MQLGYTFYIGASAEVAWDMLFIPEKSSGAFIGGAIQSCLKAGNPIRLDGPGLDGDTSFASFDWKNTLKKHSAECFFCLSKLTVSIINLIVARKQLVSCFSQHTDKCYGRGGYLLERKRDDPDLPGNGRRNWFNDEFVGHGR